jgi:hypothetical protein
MCKIAVAALVVGLAACSVFGGGAPDPMAGWGGVWTGAYNGSAGNTGALEFEFSTDTAGVVTGVARFDTGAGMDQARLETPVLTADSVSTGLSFDGMSVEILGTRTEDVATGTFVIRPSGQQQVVDSGTWEVRRSTVKD